MSKNKIHHLIIHLLIFLSCKYFQKFDKRELGSMTFGRKQFRRNDVWSNATFGRYDVSPTTTFRLLQIGRKFVELRRNLVEIWSKTDLYGKNENCLHLRFLHLQFIFTPVSVLYISTFRVLKVLICHFLGPPIASENDSTSISNN